MNVNLWQKNENHRDDGDITIGTCVVILDPEPITDYLAMDMPLLVSPGSCLVMKWKRPYTLSIDPGIPNGITKGFVLRHCKIEVTKTTALSSQCSGMFCDKQNVIEAIKSRRGCGCYSMVGRTCDIVFSHNITICTQDGSHHDSIHAKGFTSYKFDLQFMANPLPSSHSRNNYDNTERMFELEDVIQETVRRYNMKEGYSVIGWYKRGEIIDQSNKDEEVSVRNSDVNYHVVGITPETSPAQSLVDPETLFDPLHLPV